MENNRTSITFKAKVSPLESLNPEFTLCKIYVHGLGKNRNKTYISKERTEQHLSLLNYCPVVGHLFKYTDKDGVEHTAMGGHDITIDEKWNIVDLTVPYGVVVNDSFNFEMVDEYGTEVEYLTAKAILWTGRYPELKEAIYQDDFWFNESMELNITQYRTLEEDSNYTELLEWVYSALCLLGKSDDKNSPAHTEPCFISSRVFPIEFSKNEFTEAMNEMKEKLSLCFSQSKLSNEGGEPLEKLEILKKFNKTVEDLDFSIEEMSTEELSAKMEELFGTNEPVADSEPTTNQEPVVDLEPVADPEPTPEPTPAEPVQEPQAEPQAEPQVEPLTFSATYKEKREAANNALPNFVKHDDDGYCVEEIWYYLEDMSDEYLFVERYHWILDGNDDFKLGRLPYEFNEETRTVTIVGEFEEMVKVWLTLEEKAKVDADRANYEATKNAFEEYKLSHCYENEKVDELISFKTNIEAGNVFSKYENRIGETIEFKELKNNAMNYSLEQLEKECIYIVGLHAEEFSSSKPQNESKTIKFSVEPISTPEEEPYGGLMKHYLGR